MDRNIVHEPVVLVRGTRVRPYLLAYACYPSREYMLCNFKPADGNVDKIRFDLQMNARRVLVENAFGLLEGRWRILKRANCSILRLPAVVAACCVLHNFCQLMEVGEPCDGVGVCIDPHIGLARQLPRHREGRQATLAGEALAQAFIYKFSSYTIVVTLKLYHVFCVLHKQIYVLFSFH